MLIASQITEDGGVRSAYRLSIDRLSLLRYSAEHEEREARTSGRREGNSRPTDWVPAPICTSEGKESPQRTPAHIANRDAPPRCSDSAGLFPRPQAERTDRASRSR